jgi:hypothetical protein
MWRPASERGDAVPGAQPQPASAPQERLQISPRVVAKGIYLNPERQPGAARCKAASASVGQANLFPAAPLLARRGRFFDEARRQPGPL